ncbi:MAG: hypothetical protein OXT09_09605 [Myxococcales bacterium]|nr:hypothetical protein [Myxococcales bacterium]
MTDDRRVARIVAIKRRMSEARRAEVRDTAATVAKAESVAARARRVRGELMARIEAQGRTTASELAILAELSEIARRDAAGAHDELERARGLHADMTNRAAHAQRELRVFESLQERIDEQRRADDRVREQAQCDEAATRKGGEK